MQRCVIITAAGSGVRMDGSIPKQFLRLSGKPVLQHTLECFFNHSPDTYIYITLPAAHEETWKELLAKNNCNIPHQIVTGGETRFQSVFNGLQLIKDETVTAIHDGVRPFVSTSLIEKCFSEAEKFGNAVPFLAINESIRMIEGDKNETVDRSKYLIMQTPQCFHSTLIKKAYSAGNDKSFTDDASVFEKAGNKIHLIEGERRNIKITYPEDLLYGEAIKKLPELKS